MIALTLQTAESQYPYLCEPALTNSYCPSFFLPTRGPRNSWSIDVPTFSRGNPPGPAAALHTTTTTDRCLWCLLHTDDRAVCAALSTRSWQRECWGRRSVIKTQERKLTSLQWRDRPPTQPWQSIYNLSHWLIRNNNTHIHHSQSFCELLNKWSQNE